MDMWWTIPRRLGVDYIHEENGPMSDEVLHLIVSLLRLLTDLSISPARHLHETLSSPPCIMNRIHRHRLTRAMSDFGSVGTYDQQWGTLLPWLQAVTCDLTDSPQYNGNTIAFYRERFVVGLWVFYVPGFAGSIAWQNSCTFRRTLHKHLLLQNCLESENYCPLIFHCRLPGVLSNKPASKSNVY